MVPGVLSGPDPDSYATAKIEVQGSPCDSTIIVYLTHHWMNELARPEPGYSLNLHPSKTDWHLHPL